MSKLVCLGYVGFMLTNVDVLDNIFSFKSSNAPITNYEFEFNSIIVVLQWHLSLLFFAPIFFLPISSPPPPPISSELLFILNITRLGRDFIQIFASFFLLLALYLIPQQISFRHRTVSPVLFFILSINQLGLDLIHIFAPFFLNPFFFKIS